MQELGFCLLQRGREAHNRKLGFVVVYATDS